MDRTRIEAALEKAIAAPDRVWVDSQVASLERAGATVVSLPDGAYPARLRGIPVAPPVLFVRGNLACASSPAVAIVGTRAPTAAGIAFATRLARDLASLGIVVVSGLARGIDTAAHRGALAAGSPTIAVLGTGIDVVYPPENSAVMEAAAATGCVLTEQPCGTPPSAHAFPRRNRIISGLAHVTVVVEGGHKSGALITAQWAVDQGRDVGAVPGFPGDFRSAGPNRLLREGAILVESARDVIEGCTMLAREVAVQSLQPAQDSAMRANDGGDDEAAFLALLASPASVDELSRASGQPVARVQEIVTRLEIEGAVIRDGMQRLVRAPRT